VAGEDAPELHASIKSYLDRELALPHFEHGYELRYGDLPLAWMEDPRGERTVYCATRDGSWLFTRLRGGNTEATPARGGDEPVARYKSKLLPGGTIELPDGTNVKLRPPVTSDTWRVQRGRRDLVLDVRDPWKPWLVRFGDAAREIYQLPLITMFAFHALLVETETPSSGDFGGPSGIG
jgi:hypothetical protein